jgi:hypothetical protein
MLLEVIKNNSGIDSAVKDLIGNGYEVVSYSVAKGAIVLADKNHYSVRSIVDILARHNCIEKVTGYDDEELTDDDNMYSWDHVDGEDDEDESW